MCTYLTEKVTISGSGKGPAGWFRLTDASVYFDHPVHAQAEHTLNIDFLDPGACPSARVAVELTAEWPGPWPRRSRPPWTRHPRAWSPDSRSQPAAPRPCWPAGRPPEPQTSRECQCLVPLCM